MLRHSWHIKVTFITTQNTYWIWQYVIAASEGHSFMVHNGRKINVIVIETAQTGQWFCIWHTVVLQHNSIRHIRQTLYVSSVKKIWRQIELLFITTHTYQQIHWSDCQYRRPGSCNRHTHSQWILPFLVEEERGKQQWLPGQHTEHILGIGVKTDNSPPFYWK